MRTHKGLLLGLLVFFTTLAAHVASPPVAHALDLEWAHFSPQVVNRTYLGPVDLLCQPTGSFTEIRFQPAWTSGDMPLNARGDGIYGVTINAGDITAGLTDDDVNRVFAGYLRVYTGSAYSQYNTFLDVLTANVPSVTAVKLGANVQITPHLFNLTMPSYDIWSSVPAITQKFYAYYADSYDFINVVFSQGNFENRTSQTVSNNVRNIGRSIFDNTASYGSAGKLKGILRYPTPDLFDGASEAFIHEIGHTWINYLDFYPLQDLGSHWPISTLAHDIMGYTDSSSTMKQGLSFPFTFSNTGLNTWELIAAEAHPKVFSDLSLYLMGLVSAADVSTHTIFENQNQSAQAGATWMGPVIYVNGSDVVAKMGGERVPDYQNAQKAFNVATILVTKDTLASAEMMQLYDWLASRASLHTPVRVHEGLDNYTSNPFYVATGARATLGSALNVQEAPVAEPDGPYTGFEGSPLQFDGTASYDSDGTIVNYEWDLDGDGVFETVGATPTYTWADDYYGTVTLRVTDDDGASAAASTTVTILNVAPTVTGISLEQANPQFILPLVHTLTFKGIFTDPGADTWTYKWDFGDGTPNVTGTLTPTHVYGRPGTYTVTLTVTDDGAGVGTGTTKVTVVDAVTAKHDIRDYISGLPDAAFKAPAAARRTAFDNQFAAVDKMLRTQNCTGAISKLRIEIRAKADGTVDGIAANDWVLAAAAQKEVCHKIDDLVAYLKTFMP